jgi:TetR/AcrR family transcriptional regulator, transcriptional repressor for nem operon
MGGEEDPGRLTPKGRATRERIVEAAAGLMFRQGVAATSIDDVRKVAGVSGSQMTHYFRDKRSLVRAVIAWQADAVLEQHRQPALGGLDTFEALDLWAELNIARQRELHCEGGCSLGSLAGELARTDAETRAALAAGFTRWEALFRDGLQAMRDRGDLRPDADPAQLAAGLLASLQGGMLLTQTTRDIRHAEAALKTALDHIRSYATPATAPCTETPDARDQPATASAPNSDPAASRGTTAA